MDILQIFENELKKEKLRQKIRSQVNDERNFKLKRIGYRKKKDAQTRQTLDKSVAVNRSLTNNLKSLYNEKIASKSCEIDYKLINQIR